MDVDDLGYRRLLMEIVMQIEAEANAHEHPEEGEPDQRSPAIFTRGPRCGCMDVHALCPPVGQSHTTLELIGKSFLHVLVIRSGYSDLHPFLMFR